MQPASELLQCSPLAQRAFASLLVMAKGSRIRTTTVMDGLGKKLGVDQVEVKSVVRELFRAKFLRYTPDHQDLPASGIIEVERPKATPSSAEQHWVQALDASELSEKSKLILRPLFSRVSDLPVNDMAMLAHCLARLASGDNGVLSDAGFNVSARALMGGSKVLANMAPKMLQALDLPVRLQNSSPRYVICAGPVNPQATLLIENPRAFENAVRSRLAESVALVCTYGFGLSYLGQAWREDAHTEDQPIQIVRAGTPGPLTSLLLADQVFLWADLDLAALSIYRSLKSVIPQLKFSAIYQVMMEMTQDSHKSHPYAAIFEKDGQTLNPVSTFDGPDAATNLILESCRTRAVDQEAVMESDIFRLGNLPWVVQY